MSDIYISEPNDMVAIISTAGDINNDKFVIKPLEVSYGKLLDNGYFRTENGEYIIPPIEKSDIVEKNGEDIFFTDLISIYDLQKMYADVDNYDQLVYYYLRDALSNINTASLTKDGIKYESFTSKIVKEQPKKVAVLKNTLSSFYNDRLDIEDFERFMNKHIVGNESTIRTVCTTVLQNIYATDPAYVRNILSIGPTGSGKSQTWKDIEKYFIMNGIQIPVMIFDCNTFSTAGYVGSSVDDALLSMFTRAKNNMDFASKGIMVLDEFDKLGDNVGLEIKKAAQDSLLKVIEGHKFDIEADKRTGKIITIDTDPMTIVGSGAYTAIFEDRKKPVKPKIGLIQENIKEELDINRKVTDDELIKFGMRREIIPRYPVRIVYKELDKDGLKTQLKTSDNSELLLQVERFNKEYNCDLIYDEEFMDAVVEEAFKLQCGARSLRRILTDAMEIANYEILKATKNGSDIEKRKVLKLTKDTVYDSSKIEIG